MIKFDSLNKIERFMTTLENDERLTDMQMISVEETRAYLSIIEQQEKRYPTDRLHCGTQSASKSKEMTISHQWLNIIINRRMLNTQDDHVCRLFSLIPRTEDRGRERERKKRNIDSSSYTFMLTSSNQIIIRYERMNR